MKKKLATCEISEYAI